MFPGKFRWLAVVIAVLLIPVIVAACVSRDSAPSDASGSSVNADLPATAIPVESTPEPVLTVVQTPSTQATGTSTSIPADIVPTATTVPVDATETDQTGINLATAVYYVPTITCPGCVKRVEANAGKAPGVTEAKVDLSTRNVSVVYDPTVTDPEQIAEAIQAGGDVAIPVAQE